MSPRWAWALLSPERKLPGVFCLGLSGPSTAGTAYVADSPVLGKAGLPLHSWPDGWLIDDRGLHRSLAPRRHPRPIDLNLQLDRALEGRTLHVPTPLIVTLFDVVRGPVANGKVMHTSASSRAPSVNVVQRPAWKCSSAAGIIGPCFAILG